jgi:hypothetical protein
MVALKECMFSQQLQQEENENMEVLLHSQGGQ